MELPLKFALCNELFQKFPFEAACTEIKRVGYTGIEIAPFTLSSAPDSLTREDRSRLQNTMNATGLAFVGLHWLLVAPEGLHATTPDPEVRARTWNFLASLIDLCADLRTSPQDRPVMVFGSPKQRSATGGLSAAAAAEVFETELRRLAPHAERRQVQILIEPLSTAQTDVINTLEQAVAMVERIGSPAIRTMFDVHNAVDEVLPHPDLVRKYLPYLSHIHVNEMDGREPGTGQYNFRELLNTLVALNYKGWVSLEVFDFSRDSIEVASNALHHLHQAAGTTVSS